MSDILEERYPVGRSQVVELYLFLCSNCMILENHFLSPVANVQSSIRAGRWGEERERDKERESERERERKRYR